MAHPLQGITVRNQFRGQIWLGRPRQELRCKTNWGGFIIRNSRLAMSVFITPDCKILFVEMLLLDEMPPKRHCHGSSYIWKNGLDIKWPPMRSACPNQTKASSKQIECDAFVYRPPKSKFSWRFRFPIFQQYWASRASYLQIARGTT